MKEGDLITMSDESVYVPERNQKRKNSPIKLDDIYDLNLTMRKEMVEQNVAIHGTLIKLEKGQVSVNNQVERLNREVSGVKERQGICDMRINALEQKNIDRVMEIKGFNCDEIAAEKDIKKYVLAIFNRFGVSCAADKIESAYVKKFILKNNSASSVIVVKFYYESDKKDVMIQKYAYKGSEKFIYFDHALTSVNRALFLKARSVRVELKMPIVYFRDGKVQMKHKKEEKAVIIRSFEDIDNLLMNPSPGDKSDEMQQPKMQRVNPGTSETMTRNLPSVTTTNEHVAAMSQMPNVNVSKNFSIYQLNVRGLNDPNNFAILKSTITSASVMPDVLVFTEVKLKPSFPINIYNMPGYLQYSALRISNNSKGGILVFIKKCLPHNLVESTSTDFDKIVVNLALNNLKITLICVYRPPIAANLSNFLNDLERVLADNNENKLLVGDINIDWTGNASDSAKYKSLLFSYEMEVTNDIRTRPISGRIIDHVASNFHNKISFSNYTVDQDKWFTDHCGIFTLIQTSLVKSKRGCVTRSKINYEKLDEKFEWPHNVDMNDLENFANNLVKSTRGAIDACTTTISIKVKHPEKIGEHVNAELLSLINEKDKLRVKLDKKPDSVVINESYILACEKYKQLDEKLYNQYLNDNLIDQEPKAIWRGIDGILGRAKDTENEVRELVNRNGVSMKDPMKIANEFNDRFTEPADVTTSSDTETIIADEYKGANSFFLRKTDECEVEEAIDSLKSNAAAGPDGISPKIVKRLKLQLIPLLIGLVNLIFMSGSFPSILKEAIVRPIHKGDDKKDPNNYRPLSMLNFYAKVIERIMYNRILTFMEKNNFLYKSQYGFRRRSGTDNAAHEVITFIRDGLNDGMKVSAVFIDLKKAFDLVDHKVLIEVLEKMGIRGIPLKLIESYLSDRTQAVRVNKIESHKRKINCGVIQGSVLGSLFFLIVINAISLLALNGKLVLYADDAVLLHVHKKNDSVEETIKKDMSKILHFFRMRKMQLNAKKTVFMIFQLLKRPVKVPSEIEINDSCVIKRVDSFKYLGLHLDVGLKFNEHIKVTQSKTARAAGALWKLGTKIPLRCRKLIYFSLIHSHMNFMIAIWGPVAHCTIEPLQVIQNRALRSVFRLEPLHNRVKMYKDINILPIRALCYSKIAEFIYKCLRGLTLTSLQFEKRGGNTRQSNQLKIRKFNNNHGKQSILALGPKIFNGLPDEIKRAKSLFEFKRRMKEHILSSNLIVSLFERNFI